MTQGTQPTTAVFNTLEKYFRLAPGGNKLDDCQQLFLNGADLILELLYSFSEGLEGDDREMICRMLTKLALQNRGATIADRLMETSVMIMHGEDWSRRSWK